MAEPENQSDPPELHTITPLAATCRQVTGEPADLMQPSHYPVEAVCKECGRPIRTERYYSATWDHIERFTMAAPAPRPPAPRLPDDAA